MKHNWSRTNFDSEEEIRQCLHCDLPRCINCIELPDKVISWYGEQISMRELGQRLNACPQVVRRLVKAAERAEKRKNELTERPKTHTRTRAIK